MHWHIDQTVGIWSRNTFTAHELDVWYASVPADMAGGELELRKFALSGETALQSDSMPDVREQWLAYEAGAFADGALQAEAIAPRENALVRFRGGAFHRVRSFTTSSGRARTTVVLEQYRLGDEHYWKSTTFTCSARFPTP